MATIEQMSERRPGGPHEATLGPGAGDLRPSEPCGRHAKVVRTRAAMAGVVPTVARDDDGGSKSCWLAIGAWPK